MSLALRTEVELLGSMGPQCQMGDSLGSNKVGLFLHREVDRVVGIVENRNPGVGSRMGH